MIKTITLEQSDIDSLHDVIMDALNNEDMKDNLSDEFILKVWETIPKDIQDTAIHWGLDDSVVRDNIYEWIQEKTKIK